MLFNNKFFLLVICGLLFSVLLSAQNPSKLIVIPSVASGQDICSAPGKDKVLRAAMQKLDEEFAANGFKVFNYIP
ncbi:MAG: hypothetical protein U9R32_06620, partial [Bacteroidota bacterium]|nr:hypothetical protein [Bacteroidota bacterium]